MEISKLKGPHIYQNSFILQCHHQINSDLIAEMMLIIMKIDISTSVAAIQATWIWIMDMTSHI